MSDIYVKVRLKKDHEVVRTMTKRAADLLKGKWEIIGDYEEHPTYKKKEEDAHPAEDNTNWSAGAQAEVSNEVGNETQDPIQQPKKRGRKPKQA